MREPVLPSFCPAGDSQSCSVAARLVPVAPIRPRPQVEHARRRGKGTDRYGHPRAGNSPSPWEDADRRLPPLLALLIGVLTALGAGEILAAPAPAPAAATTACPPGANPADCAEWISQTLKTSVYTHNTFISLTLGIYNTDCSGFVSYVLSLVAPQQLALVPREAGFSEPRAFMYNEFFANLAAGMQAPGWAAVPSITQVQRGDIVSWGFYPIEQYHDTGHVFFAAGPPQAQPDGSLLLPVYDSSSVRHFHDSRQFPPGGIGTGALKFYIGATGVITGIQFDTHDIIFDAPVTIGRLTGTQTGGAAPAASSGRIPLPSASSADVYTKAATIVQTVKHTYYTHDHMRFDPATGTYDTDCSGFVSHVLTTTAPIQLEYAPKEIGFTIPRAKMYYEFFRSLGQGVQAPGWEAVPKLADARPGDIVAWGLFPPEQHRDTGHVFVVAETPSPQPDGTILVSVFDSTAVPHYNDNRTYPPGGVGSGALKFYLDASGVVTGVQFHQGYHVHAVTPAIGRLSGVASWYGAFLPILARVSSGGW